MWVTNSGFKYENPLNSFWSKFIMNNLSVGVKSVFSDVNCLSKFDTSLRCFCKMKDGGRLTLLSFLVSIFSWWRLLRFLVWTVVELHDFQFSPNRCDGRKDARVYLPRHVHHNPIVFVDFSSATITKRTEIFVWIFGVHRIGCHTNNYPFANVFCFFG